MTRRSRAGLAGALTVLSLVSLCSVLGCRKGGGSSAGSWHKGAGHAWRELPAPNPHAPGFTRLAPEATGVTFRNELSDENTIANQILDTGSGVALSDVDGDGLPDLYFTGLDSWNALYRNLGGWRFEDVTEKAGLACAEQRSFGASFADLDGDGDPDLVVAAVGSLRLFRNDGAFRFTETTKEAGLAGIAGAFTTSAAADVDGDGDLDLYVANYRRDTVRDSSEDLQLEMVNGALRIPPALASQFLIVDGKLRERGEPDVLLRNDGTGRFQALSFTDGTFRDADGQPLPEAPRDWGLSATFRDLDGDGAPDLYVCNDFWTPDRLYHGDGKGGFRAAPDRALRTTCALSMGSTFGDLNGDGAVDGVVVDMRDPTHEERARKIPSYAQPSSRLGQTSDRHQVNRNTLLLNRGDGTFAEAALLAGVAATGWSWSPVLHDVDLDGREDLLVTNGHTHDVQEGDAQALVRSSTATKPEELRRLLLQYPLLAQSRFAFRNTGDLKFEPMSGPWGFDQKGISRGIALADLDGDGDLDVVTNDFRAPAGLYRNEGSAPRLAVRLRGRAPNTRGVGALLTLTGGSVPRQTREMSAGGRYLSSDEPLVAFAGGEGMFERTLVVTWRSGKQSVLRGVVPGRLYEIDEAAAVDAPVPPPPPLPLFREEKGALAHRHHENGFEDTRQAFVTLRPSRPGPALATADLDADGRPDLVLGSGKDGALESRINAGGGRFTRGPSWAPAPRDIASIAVRKGSAGLEILAALSSWEDGDATRAAVAHFRVAGALLEAQPGFVGAPSSAGTLLLFDLDGDGRQDLFVGGRGVPGRYPEPASSRVFRDTGGRFVEDAAAGRALSRIGLVTAAVALDADVDGDQDLVLACEWGSLLLFRNEKGTLVAATPASMRERTGLWQSLAVADVNADGRPDLVAGNQGLNTEIREGDVLVSAGAQGGTPGAPRADELWSATRDEAGRLVPRHGLPELRQAFPARLANVLSFAAFSKMSIDDLVGAARRSLELPAAYLSSAVFLNGKDGDFEVHPLPLAAQLAPVNGIAAGDLDGDGRADLVLSQNDFSSGAFAPRAAEGVGVVLLGDGAGDFRALTVKESGFTLPDDGRAVLLVDVNGDSKLDLVAGQNAGETKLFLNQGPGR